MAALPDGAEPKAAITPRSGNLLTAQDIERIRASALKDQLARMPQFQIEGQDGNLPSKLRRFVGVWASEVGFNGGLGRHGMLIVAKVDASGRAQGFYVWGSPGPKDRRPEFPAGYVDFLGKIAGDQLTFETPRSQFTVRYGDYDRILLSEKHPDGMLGTLFATPIWRLSQSDEPATTRAVRSGKRR
jgi:hypothetical protein